MRSRLRRSATISSIVRTSEIGTRRSIVIEAVDPEIDCGHSQVKRVVGDDLLVTADIFADGHDLLDAALLVRAEDEAAWAEAPMRLVDNDRWSGSVRLTTSCRRLSGSRG